MLLDEPTAWMNPHKTGGIVTLIQAIRGMGISVLLIEHDVKVIMDASGSCRTTRRRTSFNNSMMRKAYLEL